jgi:hypothetical protein
LFFLFSLSLLLSLLYYNVIKTPISSEHRDVDREHQ